jgi:hypothetical protein
MKGKNFGPRTQVGVWLQGVALLVSATLSGCQSPYQALQLFSKQHATQLELLPTQPFPLVLGTPIQRPVASRIRVYLEGDGRAWATASQPSLDPSPRNLLTARLALNDPTPSIYLARPCQFLKPSGCSTAIWTNRRFAPEVVDSLDHALTLIKSRYGNQGFELIGYSGGAALALLLAAKRDDITQVQTLAGNLSPRAWVDLQKLSPLTGSLEPLDQRKQLAAVPQRHLLGADDSIMPTVLLQHYINTLGPAECLNSLVLPGVSHSDGWEQAWALWRSKPLDCNPSSELIDKR